MKTIIEPFFVSINMVKNYNTCPRLYYYKTIRRLELFVFNVNFLVGNLVHHGLYLSYKGYKNVEEGVRKMYRIEVRTIRKQFPEMSADDEQKLVQAEISSVGMVGGYVRRYKAFVRDTVLVENEVPIKVDIGQKIIVVGQVDNLVKNRKSGSLSLIEIKTSRYINRAYVQNIKVDFQTSTYWYMLKRMAYKKLKDILYKVIRKPSIRQTKAESKGEFLNRLSGWYDQAEDESKFHIERMKEPGISEEGVINTITRVVELCRDNAFEEKKYYQNFDSCIRGWGKCEYFPLCHEGGETKENMNLYQIRKKYKVKDKKEKKQ